MKASPYIETFVNASISLYLISLSLCSSLMDVCVQVVCGIKAGLIESFEVEKEQKFAILSEESTASDISNLQETLHAFKQLSFSPDHMKQIYQVCNGYGVIFLIMKIGILERHHCKCIVMVMPVSSYERNKKYIYFYTYKSLHLISIKCNGYKVSHHYLYCFSLKVILALLYLGNIKFQQKEGGNPSWIINKDDRGNVVTSICSKMLHSLWL